MIATGVSSNFTREPRAHSHVVPPTYRVATIASLMWRKRWEKGVTGPQLAELWECSLSTVENDASEASRMLEILGEPELVKGWAMVELHDIVVERNKDRVAALRLALEASGVIGAKGRAAESQGSRLMTMDDLKLMLGPLGYEIVEKGKTNG